MKTENLLSLYVSGYSTLVNVVKQNLSKALFHMSISGISRKQSAIDGKEDLNFSTHAMFSTSEPTLSYIMIEAFLRQGRTFYSVYSRF